MGTRWLAIEPAHCGRVATLPWHHRDPFDRMLIAQALCENMILISKDSVLAEYPAEVFVVARILRWAILETRSPP